MVESTTLVVTDLPGRSTTRLPRIKILANRPACILKPGSKTKEPFTSRSKHEDCPQTKR
jgi:hypothetical protein